MTSAKSLSAHLLDDAVDRLKSRHIWPKTLVPPRQFDASKKNVEHFDGIKVFTSRHQGKQMPIDHVTYYPATWKSLLVAAGGAFMVFMAAWIVILAQTG